MKRQLTFEPLERREMLAIGPLVSDPVSTFELSDFELVRYEGTVVTGEFSYPSPVGPVNVVVNPVPDQADYTLLEDTVLVVSAADGVSGGLSGVIHIAGPTHGHLVLEDTGGFIYVPDPDFYGLDHFVYVFDLDASLVTLSVTPLNDPPAPQADFCTTQEDLVTVIDSVLLNDIDPDGDVLSILSHTQPANGTVVHDGNGIFTYTPDADWFGTDTFEYVADDGFGGTGTATVTITVDPVNDAPTSQSDAYSTRRNQVLLVQASGGPLANDSDVEGDPIGGMSIVHAPLHGRLTVNPDSGAFLYIPDAEYTGEDLFEYTVSDGLLTSEPATVTITIVDSNLPIVRSEVYLSGPDGIIIDAAHGLTANDSPEGLTVSMVTSPAHGLMVLAADGSFTYVPDAGYVGADTFIYRATDADGLFGEEQSAFWVQASAVSTGDGLQADQPERQAVAGAWLSAADAYFHGETRKSNWDPILPPEYVDRYYGGIA